MKISLQHNKFSKLLERYSLLKKLHIYFNLTDILVRMCTRHMRASAMAWAWPKEREERRSLTFINFLSGFPTTPCISTYIVLGIMLFLPA